MQQSARCEVTPLQLLVVEFQVAEHLASLIRTFGVNLEPKILGVSAESQLHGTAYCKPLMRGARRTTSLLALGGRSRMGTSPKAGSAGICALTGGVRCQNQPEIGI